MINYRFLFLFVVLNEITQIKTVKYIKKFIYNEIQVIVPPKVYEFLLQFQQYSFTTFCFKRKYDKSNFCLKFQEKKKKKSNQKSKMKKQKNDLRRIKKTANFV